MGTVIRRPLVYLADKHSLCDALRGKNAGTNGSTPEPNARIVKHLAGDRHDNYIRLSGVIRATADNACWALLESGLVRKRKPDEDYVPELIRHRKRRLPGCSRSPLERDYLP
jgi:hypothetical protein